MHQQGHVSMEGPFSIPLLHEGQAYHVGDETLQTVQVMFRVCVQSGGDAPCTWCEQQTTGCVLSAVGTFRQ